MHGGFTCVACVGLYNVFMCFSFISRHPDKNKSPEAEDMFIKITKSYEV